MKKKTKTAKKKTKKITKIIPFDINCPNMRGLEDWLFQKIVSEYPNVNWDNLEISGIEVKIK